MPSRVGTDALLIISSCPCQLRSLPRAAWWAKAVPSGVMGGEKSKQTFTPTRLLFALSSVSSGKDEKCLALQRVSLLHCVGLEARVPGPCRDQAVRTSRFSSGVDAGRPKHLPVALAAHKKGNHHLKKKKIIKEEIHLITEGKIPSN